jgi:hypothetical protein
MKKPTARKTGRATTKRERVMHDAKKIQEISIETLTVWADANQRILRELAELSATTAKEGVRLYAEMQQSGLEALTRTAERMAATVEQSGKGIQQSLSEAVTKVKEACAA